MGKKQVVSVHNFHNMFILMCVDTLIWTSQVALMVKNPLANKGDKR